MATIPTSMRALVLHTYEVGSYASLTLEERPTPLPHQGEVLVRMAASPINPSDLAALQGLYGVPKALPAVPGVEGCGTVVKTGPGYLARRLLGKRVACAAGAGDGAWAEYMVAPARQCSPLPKSVSDEQGAMRIVNPYTAWAHLQIARQAGARAIVETAAAGALGANGQSAGSATWHSGDQRRAPRRPGRDATRAGRGAHPGQRIGGLRPPAAWPLPPARRAAGVRRGRGWHDARLLSALPAEARVVVYGGLAGELISLNPGDLIFNQRHVEGFYLARWVARQNPLALLAMQRRLYQLGDLTHAAIQLRAPLEDVQHALAAYEANMSAGKVLLSTHV